MTDPDLLDLLEILEDLAHACYIEANPGSSIESALLLAQRKISSFRTAIRQRMTHNQGEV